MTWSVVETLEPGTSDKLGEPNVAAHPAGAAPAILKEDAALPWLSVFETDTVHP